MLKSLLIHNDNTPLSSNNRILESILFSPTIKELSNSDIDAYISKKILPQITKTECEIIYIRDTLSENYIDFYGLVLAYHIRLSIKELNEKSLLPIVILSDINSFTINKITPLGRILFTKNIFLSANNDTTLIKFNDPKLNIKPLSTEEYKNNFLNKIVIDPPKDYLSHHSITNEWAIYQWSHLLGVNTEATQTNENKINTMLYFKYLVHKYNLTSKDEMSDAIKTKTGRVLLIDDKCDDGWHDVIEGFMDKNYSDIEFDSLGSSFKDIKEIGTIKKEVKNKINDFKPDIILLDLRLMEEVDNLIGTEDDEASLKHINKISGIQILKYLKDKTMGFNQGIQIIIFSASTDSLILDEIYKEGVLGYIKKDSPLNKYIASKNSLKKLKQLISGKDGGLERQYLKTIWETQNKILQLDLNVLSEKERYQIQQIVKSVYEVLSSNIEKPFTYAMYAIFKCLELVTNFYVEERKGKAYWKTNDRLLKVFNSDDMPTSTEKNNKFSENKIRMVVYEKLGMRDKTTHELIKLLVCSRNYSIHPETDSKYFCENKTIVDLKEEYIVNWFKMLETILSKVE